MANSDIIKIGFDYRASLAQFEKDTNGVFDGISNKAGKQRITIQLDAKDDKVIDKIKELQKLKLDKFTFEFGDSGLKEQLQTFDKLENKINEIINLGKGKSFIDSSPTVTDIGKIENKINELNKKYEEAQKKLSSIGSGDISGKDVNLVDNAEFQKLTQEVSKLKNQFDDLKIHIQLLDDCTVPTDRFFELQSQVETTTVKVSDLVEEFAKLSNAQKILSSTPQESNISSELDEQKKIYDGIIKNENDTFELTSDIGLSHEKLVQKISEENKQIEAGNAAFKERISLLDKQGNVIKTFVGEKDNVKSFVDKNNGAEKLLHTHPSSEEYGGNFSTADIYNFINEAIYNGVKQVELVWRDKITTLDFSGMSNKALEKFADQYAVLKKTLITHFNEIGEDGNFRNLNDLAKNAQYVDTIAQKLLSDLGGKLSSNNLIDINDKELENILSLFKEIQGIYSQISENTTLDEISKLEEKLLSIQKTYKENQVQTNDAFPKTSENLEQVTQSEQKVQQEAVATDKALDNISFTPNTEGFDDIIAKFGILREQAEQITKIVKTTKQTADGADISYKATLKNGSSYYLGENSTPQVLNANETVYDSKAIEKAYQEATKVNNALNETNSLLNSLKVPNGFEGSFSTLESEIKRLNSEFGSGKISATEYANSIKKAFSDYQTPIDNHSKDIWNELTTSLDRYATLQKRIASNNALSTDNEEATKLLEHIHELQRSDILPTEKLTASNEKLQQINQTVTDLKAKLKESTLDSLQGSIDKYQKIYNQRSTYSSDFTPSEQYTKNLTELETAIKKLVEYKNALKNVGEVTVEQEGYLKGLVTACEKASDSFKSLSASEKGASQIAIDKLVQRINKDLDECTNYSKEAKLGLRALRDELESANPRNLKEITSEIINIENAEIRAGRAGKSFFDIFKTKGMYSFIGQMQSYLSMYIGFYGVMNKIKNTISTVKELDTALVDLKKTTTMNTTQLNEFYYSANDVARQMGVTTEEIINQASAWSRLGYSSKESATKMAKLSSQFASISPGMDIDTATDGLVSTMKAFDVSVDEVQRNIMDNINKIGNTAATSNSEIVDMLTRSSAAMAAANNTLEETIALETAAVEITRSSESTGTAFKTLSMRLRGKHTLPPYTVMYMLCA